MIDLQSGESGFFNLGAISRNALRKGRICLNFKNKRNKDEIKKKTMGMLEAKWHMCVVFDFDCNTNNINLKDMIAIVLFS